MKIKFYLTSFLLVIQISSFSSSNKLFSTTTSDTFVSKVKIDNISSLKNIFEEIKRNLNFNTCFTQTLKNETNKSLEERVLASGHNSKNKFVLICKSKGLIIRIDEFEDAYRYCSWSKGKSMSSIPDLIIYNGVVEKQGTMGGYTWTFKNKEWTYVVNQVDLCETAPECGIFFELYLNDKLYKKQKMIKIK